MDWTTKAPDAEGWYWWKPEPSSSELGRTFGQIRVVEVYRSTAGLRVRGECCGCQWNDSPLVAWMDGCRWAGPIPEPGVVRMF